MLPGDPSSRGLPVKRRARLPCRGSVSTLPQVRIQHLAFGDVLLNGE